LFFLAWLAAPAGAADCPTDLTVEVRSRTIDTRRAKDLDPARYKKMKWAPGHTKTVGGGFSAGDQIARALDIEKANPTMIPAGFRAEVAARPRDPALRLRMARCELERPQTRRRASYDAALALLLGARDAGPVLMEATRNQRADGNTSRSCGDDGQCGTGLVCLGDECLSPLGLGVAYASKAEIDVEDALSRALMPLYEERHGDGYDSNDPLYWWMDRRLHHCGKFRCFFSAYEVKGKTRLVEWDQRDGAGRTACRCATSISAATSVASSVFRIARCDPLGADCRQRQQRGQRFDEIACLDAVRNRHRVDEHATHDDRTCAQEQWAQRAIAA
jgi:hypothetical protein